MQRKTLLLTAWFFPHKILRWEDAVKMIYEQTADVVVEYDEEIRSPSVTWKKPAVIKLRAKVPQMKGVKYSRINVYTRDGFRCQYCRQKFSMSALSYDHVVPRSAGGKTSWTNIVTACKPCNGRKDNKTCDEAGMWPMTAPTRPKSLRIRGPAVDPKSAPEEWKPFLEKAV